VIDLRIYRAALLPALCAVVLVMFSLQSTPTPIRAQTPPDAFDPALAARLSKAVVNAGAERTPGSRGDAAAAQFVEEQFRAIQSDEVSIQSYTGSFHGDSVDLRNVVLTLPGDSDARVVLIAHRDSASGSGATTSAAATGALLATAHSFANITHHKTLVFVSTDGGSNGGSGADQFARNYPGRERIDAAIVLSAPGVERIQPPLLLPWSASEGSTAIQLVQSAMSAISDQVGRAAGLEGTFGHLVRLAIPSGVGEGAVMIADGVDAVEITGRGRRAPPASADVPERLSPETLGRLGRATLSLMLALDATDRPLDHGPSAYVTVGGKLVPGWALALLAAAFLLPVGAAAVDGMARASRRGEPTLRNVAWVASRCLPFLVPLVLLYVLAFLGLVPDPRFPFDPARFGVGVGAAVILVVLAAALAGTCALIRPLRLPPTLAGGGVGAALALVLFVAAGGIWLANPYMALLLVPAVHAWSLAARPGTRLRPAPAVAVGVAGLLLPVLALADLAGRWEVGWRMPWDLLLMVTGHHLGVATALLWCLVGGCLVALAAIVTGGRSRLDAVPVTERELVAAPPAESAGEPVPARSESGGDAGRVDAFPNFGV
jgi:hypothetical protein